MNYYLFKQNDPGEQTKTFFFVHSILGIPKALVGRTMLIIHIHFDISFTKLPGFLDRQYQNTLVRTTNILITANAPGKPDIPKA